MRKLHGLSHKLISCITALQRPMTWDHHGFLHDESLTFDLVKSHLWPGDDKGWGRDLWFSCGGMWMVKMEFVPHICREIILAPRWVSLRNAWSYCDRKEFPFHLLDYSRIEKVMVKNRKLTLSMPHPWPNYRVTKGTWHGCTIGCIVSSYSMWIG